MIRAENTDEAWPRTERGLRADPSCSFFGERGACLGRRRRKTQLQLAAMGIDARARRARLMVDSLGKKIVVVGRIPRNLISDARGERFFFPLLQRV